MPTSPMELELFDTFMVILTTAVVGSALFRCLKLPAIIGYIAVGILVGPHVFKLIVHPEATSIVAELGIVFLLFTIGLEFSIPKLLALRKAVFGAGSLQVTLSLLVMLLLSLMIGMSIAQAIVVGSIVAMSSTAIVSKQLMEQSELHTRHGNQSIGILLFQDLAVIPMLILIPGLVHTDGMILMHHLSWALIKAIMAMTLIFVIGRWALRPLFFAIAKTRSVELFTLSALLIAVGSAWITDALGLSLALGGFLAGIMLGETEFRHQIELDIRPFRDVLLAFFFISIGTQFDISIVQTAWQWIVLLLATLVVFKTLIIAGIVRFLGLDSNDALRTGLILAHGGEFGFAILTVALTHNVLPPDYGQVVLGALLLSMVIAPIMIRFHDKLVNVMLGRAASTHINDTHDAITKTATDYHNHVIICGFGRVGQNIAHFLTKANITYLALDLDPSRVDSAALAGEPAYYANAAHYPLLQQAGIARASAVVITISETHTSETIIEQIRAHDASIPIIVRCFDEGHIESLHQIGATEVIPESLEASIMLSAHLLLFMKTPTQQVWQWVNESRRDHYSFLRMVFPGRDSLSLSEPENRRQGLQTVMLNEGAYAIGKCISAIDWGKHEVQVTCLRRNHERILAPAATTRLQAGDVLVLFGDFSTLTRVESILLDGLVL